METKVCTKCGIEKSVDLFYKSNTGKFGVSCWCKECIRLQIKNYYYKQKEGGVFNSEYHNYKYALNGKKYQNKQKETFSNYYMKKVLTSKKDIQLSDIHESVIESKKLILKIKRTLKNLQNGTSTNL